MVLEFPTIITLKNCNFCIKLCFNGVIKVLKNKENLGFICDKEDLGKVGMIINESHKPLFPRGGHLAWTPNVTIDKGKWLCGFIWLIRK